MRLILVHRNERAFNASRRRDATRKAQAPDDIRLAGAFCFLVNWLALNRNSLAVAEPKPSTHVASKPLQWLSSRWLGFIVLGAIFAAMAAWSWRKWPDVFVDFGSQLYFPWQITHGRDLYRDFEYVGGGPLSQYYHALLFKVFGVSLTTLIVSSLVLLAAFVGLIYEMFRRISDVCTATSMTAAILLVFAFSEYVWVGNYNYVCAYSSEAVHGLMISILTLFSLSHWLSQKRWRWAIVAGSGFGLVFLTKPELFLALTFTCGIALALMLRQKSAFRAGFSTRSMLAFLAGASVPWLGSVLYFSRGTGFGTGLRATAGAWITLLTSGTPKDPFYRWCMGFDTPLQNVQAILLWSGGYALGVAVVAWCCCQFSRRKKISERAIFVLIFAGIAIGTFDLPWLESGWALPLATLAISLHMLWKFWKDRTVSASDAYLPILWSGFALLLFSKMILRPRLSHYGFYLAMPAVLLNVFYLLWWLPERLRRWELHRTMFRVVILVILCIGTYRLFSVSDRFYTFKTYAVGSPPDRILTFPPEFYPRAEGIAATAKWLSANTPTNASVAVLPDGLIVNYLARRPNPTRYSSLTPLEVASYGEQKILESYRAQRPDYIVLMHRSSAEFGLGYFGQDPAYGSAFMQWIKTDYQPVWLWGSEPLQTEQFGIKVLKANRSASALP